MKNEEFQQKNTQNVERQEEESWAPWKWSLGLVSCSSLLEPPQMGFFFDHFSLRDLLIFGIDVNVLEFLFIYSTKFIFYKDFIETFFSTV